VPSDVYPPVGVGRKALSQPRQCAVIEAQVTELDRCLRTPSGMEILVDPTMYIADNQQEMSVPVHDVGSHLPLRGLPAFAEPPFLGLPMRGPFEATEKVRVARWPRSAGSAAARNAKCRVQSAKCKLHFCGFHFAVLILYSSFCNFCPWAFRKRH